VLPPSRCRTPIFPFPLRAMMDRNRVFSLLGDGRIWPLSCFGVENFSPFFSLLEILEGRSFTLPSPPFRFARRCHRTLVSPSSLFFPRKGILLDNHLSHFFPVWHKQWRRGKMSCTNLPPFFFPPFSSKRAGLGMLNRPNFPPLSLVVWGPRMCEVRFDSHPPLSFSFSPRGYSERQLRSKPRPLFSSFPPCLLLVQRAAENHVSPFFFFTVIIKHNPFSPFLPYLWLAEAHRRALFFSPLFSLFFPHGQMCRRFPPFLVGKILKPSIFLFPPSSLGAPSTSFASPEKLSLGSCRPFFSPLCQVWGLRFSCPFSFCWQQSVWPGVPPPSPPAWFRSSTLNLPSPRSLSLGWPWVEVIPNGRPPPPFFLFRWARAAEFKLLFLFFLRPFAQRDGGLGFSFFFFFFRFR